MFGITWNSNVNGPEENQLRNITEKRKMEMKALKR